MRKYNFKKCIAHFNAVINFNITKKAYMDTLVNLLNQYLSKNIICPKLQK